MNNKLNEHQAAILTLLDILRAIAQEGLSYSQNEYDTARYNKLLDIASKQYADIIGLSAKGIRELFLQEQGSITPKLGVDSAVVREDGALLVLQREDGSWGIPAGWADVGESPFQTAQRETLEESGVDITPVGYIGIAYKTPETHPGVVSQVNILVASEPIAPDKKVTLSHEHIAYKWIRSIDEIDHWHTGQKRLVPLAFNAYREKKFIPNIE